MRLLAFALLLLGCSAVPNSDISVQYKKEARKLGLYPVYPPREEFQIGDVYLFVRKKGTLDQDVSVYLGNEVRFQTAADKFMAKRIVFKPTKGKTDTNIQSDLYDFKLQQRGDRKDISALPIAAFPEISGDAGFAGGIGVLKALQAIGLAGAARTKVTLGFDDVRTYWVPQPYAVKAIGGDPASALASIINRFNRGVPSHVLEQKFERSSLKKEKDMCEDLDRLDFGISVVSRVYLTRQISYTYSNARILSAGARRATSGELSATPTAPIVNVSISQDGSVTNADGQLQALTKVLNQISGDQNTGQSVAFQTWDARGMKFENTFDRPVSIGWDGYDFLDENIGKTICAVLASFKTAQTDTIESAFGVEFQEPAQE